MPFLRENAHTADDNGALLRTTRGTLRTRARFARNETRGREVFAFEMPCAPAARWLKFGLLVISLFFVVLLFVVVC